MKRLLSFCPLFRPSLTDVMTDPWMLEKIKSSDKHHPSCYHDQVCAGVPVMDAGQGGAGRYGGGDSGCDGGVGGVVVVVVIVVVVVVMVVVVVVVVVVVMVMVVWWWWYV